MFESNSNKQNIIREILSLYGLQFAAQLLPLILIPWFSRVLGSDKWGELIFGQSFAFLIAFFVNYGFDMSGTRKIAQLKQKPSILIPVINAIHCIKLILAFLSFIIGYYIALYTPIISNNSQVIIWSLVLGIALGTNINWVFQGYNRLVFSNSAYILGNVTYTILAFGIINKPSDNWKALALQSILYIVITIGLYAKSLQFIPIQFPTKKDIIQELSDGYLLFISQAAQLLYTKINIYILGFFVSSSAISFYGSAEKIMKAAVGLLMPISKSMYPRLSEWVTQNRILAQQLHRKIVLLQFFLMSILGSIIYLFAQPIIMFVLGSGYHDVVPILKIFATILPIIALSNAYGVQWLLANNLDRTFYRIVLLAGCINIILGIIAANHWGIIGMAYTLLITEIIILILTLFATYHFNKK